MPLTDDDLGNIERLINARADLQDAKFERRIGESEARLNQRMGGLATKEQVEEVKTMLEEDYQAMAEDVETLKTDVKGLHVRQCSLENRN